MRQTSYFSKHQNPFRGVNAEQEEKEKWKEEEEEDERKEEEEEEEEEGLPGPIQRIGGAMKSRGDLAVRLLSTEVPKEWKEKGRRIKKITTSYCHFTVGRTLGG